MKTQLTLAVVFCMLFSSISGCSELNLSKQEHYNDDKPVINSDNIDDFVSVENGHVTIKDQKVYKYLFTNDSPVTQKIITEIENNPKFTSIYEVYNRAVASKLPLIIEEKESLIIRQDGTFDMDAPHMFFSRLLNKDGIIKVGNVFLKYTRSTVKLLKSSDENKLNQLNETDSSSGLVTVKKISMRPLNLGLANARYMGGPETKNLSPNYLAYVPCTVTFYIYPVYACGANCYDYDGNCTCYDLVDEYGSFEMKMENYVLRPNCGFCSAIANLISFDPFGSGNSYKPARGLAQFINWDVQVGSMPTQSGTIRNYSSFSLIKTLPAGGMLTGRNVTGTVTFGNDFYLPAKTVTFFFE